MLVKWSQNISLESNMWLKQNNLNFTNIEKQKLID